MKALLLGVVVFRPSFLAQRLQRLQRLQHRADRRSATGVRFPRITAAPPNVVPTWTERSSKSPGSPGPAADQLSPQARSPRRTQPRHWC